MMDPVTGIALGTLASQVVAKLGEKALEKSTDAAVDAAPGAVRRVVEWVRSRFGDTPEFQALEEAPDSARREKALGEIIDAELIDDKSAREELAELLRQADRADTTNIYIGGNVSATDRGVTVIGSHTGTISTGRGSAD